MPALRWVIARGLLVTWLAGSLVVCPLRCLGTEWSPWGGSSSPASEDAAGGHSGCNGPCGRPDGHGDDRGPKPCSPSECQCVCNGVLAELGVGTEPLEMLAVGPAAAASPCLAPTSVDDTNRSLSMVTAPRLRADSALELRAVLSCWLL
jgi:hypothetical protein